jgi:transketolase
MSPEAVIHAERAPAGERVDRLCIDTIRTLAMDAVENAKSGHPGMPRAMAPVAYLLYTRYLRHNPRDPGWPDRDRFVLSAGHGSMLLYSVLHLCGYDLSLEELKRFRQIMDHRVFAICSDGDLMEGVASEAASLAGHLGLGRIVYLCDDNHRGCRCWIEGGWPRRADWHGAPTSSPVQRGGAMRSSP